MTLGVSVIMPVYNGAPYLREAVESILNQTFSDFEFIIVDDGSTDETPDILQSYSDPRITVLRHETNQGGAQARNHGMSMARAELIAVQDADDVSLPERLATQIAFLEANPEVGLVGSSYIRIAEDGTFLRQAAFEVDDLKLKWLLLFKNSFSHPSVVFRRELAQAVGNYCQDEYPSDDYGLWSRMAGVSRLANIAEPLVKYRIRWDSLTRHPDSIMRQTSLSVSTKNIRDMGGDDLPMEAVRFLQMLHRGKVKQWPIEELRRQARRQFPVLHRQVVPLLLDRFCRRHQITGPAKRAFQKWARGGIGRSVLAVVDSHVDREERLLRRPVLVRLVVESLRLHFGLIVDEFTLRVVLKIGLGASLVKTARRMMKSHA